MPISDLMEQERRRTLAWPSGMTLDPVRYADLPVSGSWKDDWLSFYRMPDGRHDHVLKVGILAA